MTFSEQRKIIYDICKYSSSVLLEEVKELDSIILFTNQKQLDEGTLDRINDGLLEPFYKSALGNLFKNYKYVVYDIEYDDIKYYKELYNLIPIYMDHEDVIDRYGRKEC